MKTILLIMLASIQANAFTCKSTIHEILTTNREYYSLEASASKESGMFESKLLSPMSCELSIKPTEKDEKTTRVYRMVSLECGLFKKDKSLTFGTNGQFFMNSINEPIILSIRKGNTAYSVLVECN